MLKLATAYVATGATLAVLDAFWLRTMSERFYRAEIGSIMGEVRWPPALAFYFLYIAGILYFAALPAVATGRWQLALVNGALFGFFCYLTYDLTNHATLKLWRFRLTLVDVAWGTILTATAAAIDAAVTLAVTRP